MAFAIQKIKNLTAHFRYACIWQWFAAQHAHALFRARCLHDAHSIHIQHGTAPLPAYMAQRAAVRLAPAQVEVVRSLEHSGGQDSAGRKRKRGAAGEDTALEERDEKRRAMADFAVTNLSTELFTELMQGFTGRGYYAGAEPVMMLG
jgi:hypothetical protein